ncbi:MAG: MFS transporter [Candidatus Rokubacteria bacterium]|nr:MFS transporter [Candidatus Rokubacteria bacterium]
MALPAGLRALGQRDYRVYYVGNLVSQVGTWMQTISQSWLVLQLTGSPFLLGLIATLQSGPILLFSAFTGVLADRLTKRHLLVTTQAVQGCLALTLGLLVWSGRTAYWHVATIAVFWGLVNALDQPARQAFVMELTGRERVASAIGLNSASFNAARIVGPAIAGVLIARVGLSSGFLLNALAFAVAITTLLEVPARPPRPRPTATTFAADLGEGFAYVARTDVVRFVLALQVVVSFCVFNFTVYVPLLARDVLGQGSEGFGFLMAALGVGAVLAGLLLGTLAAREPPPVGIALALATACTLLLGLALVRQFRVAAVLLGLTGFAGTVVMAGCNSFLQLTVPDALRGRVMSLYTLLSSGVFPVGAFFVGFVSQAWGVSTAFAVNGALGLLALLLLRPWVLRARPLPGSSGP